MYPYPQRVATGSAKRNDPDACHVDDNSRRHSLSFQSATVVAVTRVAVNGAIDLRGISGTARALEAIRASIGRDPSLTMSEVIPAHPPNRGTLLNAVDQLRWDMWLAARADPKADVLVSPCNLGLARRNQGHILVLHDTMMLDAPHLFDPRYVAFMRVLLGPSVRAATVVVVPSEFTKSRVQARWTPKRVMVARWPIELPSNFKQEVEPGHILMVGVTEPYKNHALGVAAVSAARQATGAPLKLTLVGPEGRAEIEVLKALRQADPDGTWTRREVSVSQASLDSLYSRAWLLLQPSVLEGYGFPVAEAAIRGVPAIHSGAGSLNEIAPACVDDPKSVASYVAAITHMLSDATYSAAREAALDAAESLTPARFASVFNGAIALASSGRH